MTTVEIGTLRARYQGVFTPSERRQLDDVIRDGIGSWLPTALAGAGVGAHEDVCIRRLHVRTRVPDRRTTNDVTATWCAALGDAVEQLLASGGDDVVRYPSRIHTLVDLVVSSARGDLGRAWAWRELGLLSGGQGARGAVAAAADALLSDPTTIVPVLASLAGRPGDFTRFCLALGVGELGLLARMAAVAGGAALGSGPAGNADAELGRPGEPGPSRSGDGAVSHRIRMTRLRERSAVVRAAPAVVAARPDAAFALAALGLLESDPASLRRAGGAAQALVEALAGALGADARGDVAPGRPGPSLPGRRGASVPWETEGSAASGTPGNRPALRTESGDEVPGRGAVDGVTTPVRREVGLPPRDASPERGVAATPAASPTEEEATDGTVRRREGPLAESEADDASTADDVTAPETMTPLAATLRREGDTAHGGLLLLLNVLAGSGIADALLSAPELQARGGRWLLHALGVKLSGADPDDPAALAFCGLRPGEAPPETDGALAGEELAALDAARQAVTEALGERLELARAVDPVELHDLVARPARVVADPGWIEVRFSLDHVSTEVRRAGLDADPGFLSWLGVVVRFSYG